MSDLSTIQTMLDHSNWANQCLVTATAQLGESGLDQPFDIGMGTLRKTLLHILAGEAVWLQRWMGRRDTPWPDEDEKIGPATIGERFHGVWADRKRFLNSIKNEDTSGIIVYRDSKGTLYQATLGDMMIQMILHSAHHRAQAVNMLRRVGGAAPELDYMYHVRKPV